MVTVTAVEFAGHGGVVLRGDLYTPDGELPAPGVVMTHGFSAVRTMALPDYATGIAAAGFVVLVYDHRNLGDSDGEPRQEINPWAQSRDYRRAIDWFGGHEAVDADRIAVWGSSFSGGEVMVVGAIDERVRAVVANVPFAGLPGVDYRDTGTRFAAIERALEDEGERALAGQGGDTIGPLAVADDGTTELPVFLPQSEAADWFLTAGPDAGTWHNQVTLRNAFGTEPAFDPGVCIGHLSPTPLLMIVATEDRVAETEVALAAFERAGHPKQLEMIDGHHFAPYAGQELDRSVTATVAFLEQHLGGT